MGRKEDRISEMIEVWEGKKKWSKDQGSQYKEERKKYKNMGCRRAKEKKNVTIACYMFWGP